MQVICTVYTKDYIRRQRKPTDDNCVLGRIATRIVESLCVLVECVYIDSQYRITEIDLNSIPLFDIILTTYINNRKK